MRLLRRLRPLIAPAALPPPEVYGALIDDLHAPLFSLVAGASTTILVGTMAAWRTGNLWLAALTAGTAAVTIARIVTIAKYRNGRSRHGGDIDFLRSFKQRYATGAIVFAALLGLMGLIAYLFTNDTISFRQASRPGAIVVVVQCDTP
jgi:hypothetical protein